MSEPDVGPGALRGQRVLVPRTPERAGELVSLLQSAGAEVIALPLIDIAAPADPAAFDLSLVTLAKGGYSWVGFTSVTAVTAVLDRAAELALWPAISADTRVAAVGPATAAALRARDVPVDLVPSAAGSAEALAAAWPHGEGQTVLLPRSDLSASALPVALLAKGYRVDDVTAYRTEPVRPPDDVADELRTGRITAVLFTSPSTVTALDGLELAAAMVLGAIGRPTAAAVEKSGRRLDFVAERPTAQALVAGLITEVQRSGSGPPTFTAGTDQQQHRRVEA
jgi:uroporphyrinogen-III synthase